MAVFPLHLLTWSMRCKEGLINSWEDGEEGHEQERSRSDFCLQNVCPGMVVPVLRLLQTGGQGEAREELCS